MNTVELINEYFLALSPRRQLHVLLIDDDVEFLGMTGAALRRYGALVDTANSGEAGCELSAGAGYDLILLDIKMPGIGGVEALRRIKAGKPDARVVLCTGMAHERDLADAAPYAPFGIIEKSLDFSRFIELFRHYNLLREPLNGA